MRHVEVGLCIIIFDAPLVALCCRETRELRVIECGVTTKTEAATERCGTSKQNDNKTSFGGVDDVFECHAFGKHVHLLPVCDILSAHISTTTDEEM